MPNYRTFFGIKSLAAELETLLDLPILILGTKNKPLLLNADRDKILRKDFLSEDLSQSYQEDVVCGKLYGAVEAQG